MLLRLECVVMMIIGRCGCSLWICVSRLRLLVLGMWILEMIMFGCCWLRWLIMLLVLLKFIVVMFFCCRVFFSI